MARSGDDEAGERVSGAAVACEASVMFFSDGWVTAGCAASEMVVLDVLVLGTSSCCVSTLGTS